MLAEGCVALKARRGRRDPPGEQSKTDDEEQNPARRGGGSEGLVKVDAENMIDEKLNLGMKAQQDIDKLMKTVVELQKNIAKVIEDEEDKQKVDQLDIEDSIAKAQRLRDEMGESLKSARNAKLAGFHAARAVVVKKQAEATQLLGTIASSVKACKKLVAARNDKDKKAKGKVAYDEGKRAKHFQNLGCGRRRAQLGSALLFYGVHLEKERPDNWIAPVASRVFSEEKVLLFEVDDSPVQQVLASLSADFSASEDRMSVLLNKKPSWSSTSLSCQTSGRADVYL